jgi:UDP:flavonoid glycosyltransferase YjiC (YdhE family)
VRGPRVLYVSGSIGLGHVKRDLAIAGELRRLNPGVEIVWLAAVPASDVLAQAGETLVPECAEFRNETEVAEAAAGGGGLNLTRYVYRALVTWFHNARVIGRAAKGADIDVLVGNETYEVIVAYVFGIRVLPPVPFVMMYDFWGMDVTSGGFFERLGAWALNFIWAQERRITTRGRNAAVFIGEPEDIPDRKFGLFLPNRRRHAADHVTFVGYALTFSPGEVSDRDAIRRELGYGDEPVVVCAVGGTAIGRELLELCGRAYSLAAQHMPGLRMLLVCGPRIDPLQLDVPDGVETAGMVPELWRHFAVCDLAIVQGGGTTTLELEALRTPFLFFPIEGHAEQELTIGPRLARHGAGVPMTLSLTSPESLAEAIVLNVGKPVEYPPILTDGAHLAAEMILDRARVGPSPERPGSS